MELSDATDDQLWSVCRKLPSDFRPYGDRKHDGNPDCSTCRWFQPLLRPGQLDWGTCANPQSPRGGLLTFWAQGCDRFEEQKEVGTADTRRTRSDFQDRVENMLRDTLHEFADAEVAKVNRPFPNDEFRVFRHEDKLDTLFFSEIPHLFQHTPADFDRLAAADQMVEETKQDSKRFWELAQRSLARWLKRDASTIRLPDNMDKLEDEFWSRVHDAITEALEGKGEE